MTTVRVLRSVTRNLLGTFTSRYSEHNGYWFFGFLNPNLVVDIDLLAQRAVASSPTDELREHARDRFLEQLKKSRLPRESLRSAALTISFSSPERAQLVCGSARLGRDATFTVIVRATSNRVFQASRSLFVAPHDPAAESRSARAAAPGSPELT